MNYLQSDVMIELHVPDFKPIKEFYGVLGFEVVWERKEEDTKRSYLVIKRQSSILNFYCGTEEVYTHSYFSKYPKDTKRGYATEIIIPSDDIKSDYQLVKENYPQNIVKEVNSKFSHNDFRVEDPFGYYLRFVERYDWVTGRDANGNVSVR